MKKINIKIILISLFALVLINITVFAVVNKLNPTLVVSDDDNNVKNELLEEKQSLNNTRVSQKIIDTNKAEEDTELTEKLNKGELEAKEFENSIIDIINKFSPNEFAEIQEQLEQYDINSDNINSSPIIDLYNLILNILETQNLSNNESSILKEFMNDQYDNVKDNLYLREKIENICKD